MHSLFLGQEDLTAKCFHVDWKRMTFYHSLSCSLKNSTKDAKRYISLFFFFVINEAVKEPNKSDSFFPWTASQYANIFYYICSKIHVTLDSFQLARCKCTFRKLAVGGSWSSGQLKTVSVFRENVSHSRIFFSFLQQLKAHCPCGKSEIFIGGELTLNIMKKLLCLVKTFHRSRIDLTTHLIEKIPIKLTHSSPPQTGKSPMNFEHLH